MKTRKANTNEMPLVRSLFENYQKELGIDLCFQDFGKELAELPGVYSEPEGCILFAEIEGKIAGVVALKKIGEGICEMKRLYIKPEFRGKNLGKLLAREIISEAKAKAYKQLNLDTLSTLKAAISLYQSMGFEATEPYNFNPNETVKYFKLDLKNG